MITSTFKPIYVDAILYSDSETGDPKSVQADMALVGTAAVDGYRKTIDNLLMLDFKIRELLAERQGVAEASLLHKELLTRANNRDKIDASMRSITEYLSLMMTIVSMKERGEGTSGQEEALELFGNEVKKGDVWVMPMFICRGILRNLKAFPEYTPEWGRSYLTGLVEIS